MTSGDQGPIRAGSGDIQPIRSGKGWDKNILCWCQQMVSGQLGVGRGSPSWPLWPYDSDILNCPGTIVPPQWSVIFAIKWRYEGSSWRAANLFPIIIVTNVTESTSNIFFYLLIRYFLSPVTIDRGKDPKRAGSAVMFLSNFSRVIEMFNLHQSLTQSSKPSARLSPI